MQERGLDHSGLDRVRLDQIRDRPFTWDLTETVDAGVIGHPDLQALSPVRWRGEIRFVDPGYLLTATYEYQQTLTCQRCLAPLTEPVRQELSLLLVAGPSAPSEGEHELAAEDLGVVEVDEDEELDLRPFLLEAILLNVPMKPLCRAACKGLCPSCGKDLNEGDCDCQKTEIDPRWEALRAFQERKKDH
jgi:uncharacterized protein